MCGEYNGWTNWETWNIKLWVDNSEGLYNHVTQTARAFDKEDITGFAKYLRNLVEEVWFQFAMAQTGPLADATISYLNTVDWDSVSESYLEEANS